MGKAITFDDAYMYIDDYLCEFYEGRQYLDLYNQEAVRVAGTYAYIKILYCSHPSLWKSAIIVFKSKVQQLGSFKTL